MYKKYLSILGGILAAFSLLAAPGVTDEHIKVDQFGYPCNAEKVAVISNPQTGYNAPDPFTPGGTYEVRDWNTDVMVFSGPAVQWNGGATHTQSGDQVWWFDFSSVTAPGDYYIWDPANTVGSYRFQIGDPYAEVLKHAVRSFYYQRCGVDKTATHAGAGWADTDCHLGTEQDNDCRLYNNTSPATSKDLSGGWHDAGDYNKYVNFTWSTLISMLTAYEENPTVWGDDYNIPESGNGIPDILDEIKWELDWILKMQQADGSVLSIVGEPSSGGGGSAYSPPSVDTDVRRYGPATTSASLTTAGVLALAAIQFNSVGQTAYATTLENAAIAAWNWADANPAVTWNNTGNIRAGEQEIDAYGRTSRKVAAACFLYALTGNATYKTFFDNNYDQIHLIQWGFAYPFEQTEQSVLLYYTKLPGADAGVSTDIQTSFTNSVSTNNTDNLPSYLNQDDAYRAYLSDGNHTWGSNNTKSRQGLMFIDMLIHGLDPGNAANYENAALGFINYIHGVNPNDFCYLTNMGGYGAENSVNELYHSWFHDGSAQWDRVGVSTFGPAPGILTGGANPNWGLDGCCPGGCGGSNGLCVTLTPPESQPVLKSYRDWNTTWPQNSWEITENGIYYQASYIKLLSYFVAQCASGPDCTQPSLGADTTLCGTGGTLVLNANSATHPDKTYEWILGGGTIRGPVAGKDTIHVTTGGTYEVIVDSAGCIKSDVIIVSANIPAPDLGPDVNICDPASVTLDPGVTGGAYSFEWQYNSGTINGESDPTLPNVRASGTYDVIISATGCPDASDQITITSSLPTPVDDCISAPGTADLSITNPGLGAGPYEWFDDPVAGSSVGNGTSITTPSISSTTTYYVQDGGATGGTVGPTSLLGNETDWGINAGNHLHFTAHANFTLTGLSIPTRCYNTNSFTYTIEILDNGGNPIGGGQTFTTDATSCPAGGGADYLIPLTFNGGAGILIDQASWGSDLRMRLTAGPNPLWNNNAAATFTYNSTPSGIVDITGKSGGGGANAYMYFYDWQIQTGTPCARLPVIAQVGGCSGLPVTWLSFNARADKKSVTLDWATASESNSSHFLVQRSADGVNYNAIGHVQAAGNSSSVLHYAFADNHPIRGTSYYRLKQIDLDGSVSYSEVKTVLFEGIKDHVKLYPQPNTGTVNIVVSPAPEQADIKIYDQLGKAVWDQKVKTENGTIVLDLSKLENGVYFIELSMGEKIYREVMIKI